MLRPSKLATSIRASVVSSPHLRVLGTHDSGDHESPLFVGDHEHLLVEVARGTIEKCDPLAEASPRLTTMPPRTFGGVEGVDGLARLEHDVVGRVHDSVYGAHAGGEDPTPHL